MLTLISLASYASYSLQINIIEKVKTGNYSYGNKSLEITDPQKSHTSTVRS